MADEESKLSQAEINLRTALLKTTNNVEEIDGLFGTDDLRVDSLDDYLYNKKPSNTIIGLTIEKASEEWPNSTARIVQLIKKEIATGADFVRSLANESKRNPPRDGLKILLEIIFGESLNVTNDSSGKDKLEELARKASNDKKFLGTIQDLFGYYNVNDHLMSCGTYKNLEFKRQKLQLHRIQTDPYFRSLKWILETSSLFPEYLRPERMAYRKQMKINDEGYEFIQDAKEFLVLQDDIFLETLQLVSDVRSEIHGCGTDNYLDLEYQNLSDQAEEFAVALIDKVKNEKELSIVIKMEDKFSEGDSGVFEDRLTWMRQGVERASLIQHAVNLRCKSFVVSKNCQHLLEYVIYGSKPFYRFWNDPRIMTGTGMPTLIILTLKLLFGLCSGVVMTVALPLYILLSTVSWCFKIRECFQGFLELYERPCQKYLFDLWCFLVFLGLVIYTSQEEDFNQKEDLSSGLTIPDTFVFIFVATFGLRLILCACVRLQIVYTIPRYRRNWRLLIPDILTVVETVSLTFFSVSFICWAVHWDQIDGWRQSDHIYRTADMFYATASLLCFIKLAHFLKAERMLGTLNLSLYMMFTKDVIYFAIIFVLLLYVPFATGLRKMYSYYVIDNTKNSTQPLASYRTIYDDLLWAMLGSDEKKDGDITDPDYADIKRLGEAFIAMFTLSAVVVAFNMLVATMNHTYEDIMKNLDKEYVFSRTKMWLEYIAEDHSVLPPPLNITDVTKFCKYCSKRRGENPQHKDVENKRNERISIIKQLVVRYLRQSLDLEDTEPFSVTCEKEVSVSSQRSRQADQVV